MTKLAFLAWVRLQPCLVCGAAGADPAHVRTRGAGGKDDANVVPLCRVCHTEQHKIGILTFQKRYGLNLKREAWEVFEQWKNEVTVIQ